MDTECPACNNTIVIEKAPVESHFPEPKAQHISSVQKENPPTNNQLAGVTLPSSTAFSPNVNPNPIDHPTSATTNPPVSIVCPHCTIRFWVNEDSNGSKTECPACKNSFIVGQNAAIGSPPVTNSYIIPPSPVDNSSTFEFICPHCAGRFTAQHGWIGQQTQCPTCRNQITVNKPAPVINLVPINQGIVLQPIQHTQLQPLLQPLPAGYQPPPYGQHYSMNGSAPLNPADIHLWIWAILLFIPIVGIFGSIILYFYDRKFCNDGKKVSASSAAIGLLLCPAVYLFERAKISNHAPAYAIVALVAQCLNVVISIMFSGGK